MGAAHKFNECFHQLHYTSVQPAVFWKWLSLAALMVQSAITPLLFRLVATRKSATQQQDPIVVAISTEGLKLLLSVTAIMLEQQCNLSSCMKAINEQSGLHDMYKLLVPAVLFTVQYVCLQRSAAHLPAALFQVLYQAKTLVIAGCSVMLLNKTVLRGQWLAICLLVVGLVMVQSSDPTEQKQSLMDNALEQNIASGLAYLLTACLCSGFGSVYFEHLLKITSMKKPGKTCSTWAKNFHLSALSVAIDGCALSVSRWHSGTTQVPLLQGFSSSVWIMVVNNAIGGMIVTLVVKYADNIQRGFATSLATVFATVGAVFLFGFVIRAQFCLGAGVVLGSSMLYSGVLKLPGDWWNEEPSLRLSLHHKKP